jgi:tRNA(adenine34) deaminase
MAFESFPHEYFMKEALAEAEKARLMGEVPVGCVMVREERVIARGFNLRESSQDPTAHAELIALKRAAEALGTWRLIDVVAYVTLEPCPMCAGALVNSRISRVVFGCDDPKAGALRTLYQIGSDGRLNHRFESIPGVLNEECSSLLSKFFSQIRENSGRP